MTSISAAQTDPDRLARTMFIATMLIAALFIIVTMFVMAMSNAQSAPDAAQGGTDVSVWALQNP